MNSPKLHSKRSWALIIIGALLVMGLVGGLTFAILYQQTSERANSTVEYVKRQSLECELVNNANVMKSQIRVMQNASQVARDIDADSKDLSEEKLQQYASELHLTSIFILNTKGKVVAQTQGDEDSLDDIKPLLAEDAVLDTANHPKKVYATRIFFDDGSYADFSCARRLDTKGIVVVLYHTEAEYANRFLLTLQNLLDGYRIANDTSVVVEKDGQVVASSIIGNDADVQNVENGNAQISSSIKEHAEAGQMCLVKGDSAYYYGVYGKARDYYVYTFSKASRLLHYVASNSVIALIGYLAIVFLFIAVRRRSEHKHLELLLDQEQQYASRLEESVKVAQSASAAKTDFLQRMSHDLRTPLNGIVGMIEVGDSCPDDPAKQAECRKKMRMASGILLDLVNEALDMTKLESENIQLDAEAVDLRKIINDAYDVVERQGASRGIRVSKESVGVEHPYVKSSSLYLQRLFMNIVTNAVKYNKPGGEVQITHRELPFAEGIATHQVAVKDTGIGMSDEFQKCIFEPFSREEQELDCKPSGTGLGLSIVKKLTDLMGGSVVFESEIGKGTTCTVTIPFEVADKSEAIVSTADNDTIASLDGINVLMAEDNELNSEIAEFIVTRAGATIETAQNGQQALERFESAAPGTFDVILMDIMMPVMGGYDAARAIRALPRQDAKDIPIIAISANAFADDRAQSRAAGMNVHLAKPLDPDELINTISALTRG